MSIPSCKQAICIPVYDEDIDDIEGIIYVKDLLRLLADDKREFAISDYLRKVLFMYENMMCDELLPLFQKQKVHIAIVLMNMVELMELSLWKIY